MASFGQRGGGFRQAAPSGVSYSAGERVRHAKFGVGQVVEAGDGKVVVRFGAEERTFVPEMAPLSKE
jgi:DNA helicase-2/ATP-dependent DNA helicase PcrA